MQIRAQMKGLITQVDVSCVFKMELFPHVIRIRYLVGHLFQAYIDLGCCLLCKGINFTSEQLKLGPRMSLFLPSKVFPNPPPSFRCCASGDAQINCIKIAWLLINRRFLGPNINLNHYQWRGSSFLASHYPADSCFVNHIFCLSHQQEKKWFWVRSSLSYT